jgi:hypothetical protein
MFFIWQVMALKVILNSIQAKGKERQWIMHHTYGDFDDSKIIEGLSGEKNIYCRRAEITSEKAKTLKAFGRRFGEHV